MIHRTVLLILFFIFFFSCSNPGKVDMEEKQNTLIYEDKYGIVSYLQIEDQHFSLDETIRVGLLTINHSDTHKVYIHTRSAPLWHYTIYNEEMKRVDYYPKFINPVIIDFYLNPGDTFKSNLTWTQTMGSYDRFAGLKVFSGDYYITGDQPGLPSGKVGVWIHISEVGEPLSTKLFWNFSVQDSILIDFLVRNRISKELTFQMKENVPPRIQFFDSVSDTLVKEMDLNLTFAKIELPPKSDLKIFSYQESKSNLINMGLLGSFLCKIIIPCQERDIIAMGFIVIN